MYVIFSDICYNKISTKIVCILIVSTTVVRNSPSWPLLWHQQDTNAISWTHLLYWVCEYMGHYMTHHLILRKCKSLLLLHPLPASLLEMGPMNKPRSFSFLERFCFQLSLLCYVSFVAWWVSPKASCWRQQVLWAARGLWEGNLVGSLKGNIMFLFLIQYLWGFYHW